MSYEFIENVPLAIGIALAGMLLLLMSSFWIRGAGRTVFLRALAIGLLSFALIGPILEHEEPGSRATVLVDVSESLNEAIGQNLLDNASRLSDDTLFLSYMPFAGEPALVSEERVESYRNLRNQWGSLNVGETNIENALKRTLAAGIENLILVSDGFETRGSLIRILDRAKEKGVRIFPLVPDDTSEEASRFELIKLSAPLVAPAEKSVEVRATIRNEFSTSQAGLLEIKHGKKIIQKKTVTIEPNQEYVIKAESDSSQEGTQEVVATFTPVNPKIAPTTKTIFVSGEKREKVLLLSGNSQDARLLEDVFNGQKFRLVSMIAPDPQTIIPELEDFSVVIINNVHSRQLPTSFARKFESFVRTGGGGLMIGGNQSFGLGGYLGSAIEKALPVEMIPPQTQQKRLNVAVSLILDKSRSMANDDKIYYAKEAASTVIKNLKDDDLIEVIGFDASPFVVVKLSPLSEVRSSALDRVNRLFPAGRTNLLPALHEARRSFSRVEAGRKHMIILTDGKVPDAGPYYMELVNQLHNEGVTVSTVLLGDETDTQQLRDMASAGGGAFHQTTNATSLARIFLDDIRVSTGEKTLKESLQFNVRKGSSPIKSTDITAFPPLRGYVQARAKKDAAVELIVTQQDKAEPLFVSWAYGQGHGAAFTSDANGRWSSFWAEWEKFGSFWSDVIESLKPAGGSKGEAVKFDLRYSVEHGALNLDLAIYSADAIGALNTVLKLPGGQDREVTFAQESTGRYRASIEGVTAGRYEFKASIGRRTLTPVSFYLPGELFGEKEGRGFNREILSLMAAQTGGKINPSKEELLLNAKKEVTKFYLMYPLIALGIFCLLLEILVREGAFMFLNRRSA